MRRFLSILSLTTLIIAICDAPSAMQREVSTRERFYNISENGWPGGLFYGLDNVLYWIRFRDSQLFVYCVREDKIERVRVADLDGMPSNLRMTAVTSDLRNSLFVLFSGAGPEEFLVRLSLDDTEGIEQYTFPVHGFAQLVRYLAELDAAVVVGQNSSVLVHRDGTFNLFGPEAFHGPGCCVFAAVAVNYDTAAFNVEQGLRLYYHDKEQSIWPISQPGSIQEIASAGNAWAAIEYNPKGEQLRVFFPQDPGFGCRVVPLPKADLWRITDYGHQAIVWSRQSDNALRVIGRHIELFKLKEEKHRGRICPGHSESIFLISGTGYTMINFDEVGKHNCL
ncbi:MAG: hypothetical protein GY835_04925 [bacterium]|nr:hypothetical protein [bacterium]